MKLLVNPTSYSNAIHLINLGVDQIFIGTNKYCTRNSCNLSINEIKDLAENKKSTEVIVSINKLFFENEIEDLTKYIIELSKININGIIFADYAVNQICFENDINIRLIYNPDTLVVNYAQFDFYLSNNIKEVSLAREINKKEILEIIANKKEMNTQLQVCGYAFMMHSR
ncbi:hypothetical protein FACS189459_3910 [Bacilli bacterium]|nr:hypothetical protein FACS189459_3910 [Bacilli bacterium]